MNKHFFSVAIAFCMFCGQLKAQNYAFPLETKMWKTSTISVCWDNIEATTDVQRKWVQEAIHETWERYSAVQFTDWVSATVKDADVHIFIGDQRPETVKLGNQIQHKARGVILNFTFKEWSMGCNAAAEFCIKATAVHEFGHVLGFAHEQNKLECKFPNCLQEPQGENGDWHMNQCDLKSIMNYCNPDRDHSYLLSEQDIKALQYFYHVPGNQMSLFRGIELVHNSSIINRKNLGTQKINHQINVFVVGDADKIEGIEKVVYFLDDETFKHPVITIRDKEGRFGLGLRVWESFRLIAIVFNKNGDIQVLKSDLKFNDNESVSAGNQ